MGLFEKLKNVLFEEEEVEIPVLTKSEEKPKEEVAVKKEPVQQERKTNVERSSERASEPKRQESRSKEMNEDDIATLRNVKRDIDLNLDFGKTFEMNLQNNLNEATKETEEKEEDNSPFLSFDEDEFERLNSKIYNQTKAPKEVKKQEIKEESKPRVTVAEPKKFVPSPVISPVYGILDKNYRKEDITLKSEDVESDLDSVSVDSVRKKAFGTLEDDIETTLIPDEVTITPSENEDKSIDEIISETISDEIEEIPVIVDEEIVEEEKEEQKPLIEEEIFEEPITEKADSLEKAIEEIKDTEEEINKIEEIVKEDEVSKVEDIIEEDNLNVEDPIEEDLNVETPNDILEKTNTLKILDDIEKELNDITEKHDEDLVLEDTRETDLFNLIDSMYQDKEEEGNEE